MEISNFVRDLLYDGGGGGSLYPLVKPSIVLGNYFLTWHEKSLGLYSNEVVKFKNFLKSMIPYLENMMKIIDGSSSILSAKNDPLKKVLFDKGRLSITDKYNSHIFFILNIDNTGSTALFREECLLINDEICEKMENRYGSANVILLNKLKEFDNIVSVKWKLGDLLFDRAAHK
jgi:hypothetical protein